MLHVCGLYYLVPGPNSWHPQRKYLPQVSLSAHARIVSSTSRTTLTQVFVNPSQESEIPELRYTFPLYDGVSVVGFVCTINKDRVIRGIVKERAEARKTYDAAVARGETAGLLEQLPDASDVFTTTIGNVPAGAEIKVDITYLGELKHDAEVDGIRFTIPTSIAPRYGSYPGEMLEATSVKTSSGISVVVDAEMPNGSQIKSVQSPSHPISVTIGNTSAGEASGAEMSLQKASATLSLGSAELGQDFVLHVVATNTANPVAVLETHPTIPNHRALMATLVPKFNLPSSKPEIVFLCDRSGSMGSGNKIPNMKSALNIFLKSIPVGVKFNICSFGSHHELLFKRGSQTYDASSLAKATAYVEKFDANFGGTEIYEPMEHIFKKRFTDMDLEVFLLTDGEIWDQDRLFTMINQHMGESKGAIRVFTLGIGRDVSHALIEGVARAGNGFAQSVGDDEKMNSKVVRMLKASLTPHVRDYTLEVKYGNETMGSDDDFEVIEKVMDALTVDVPEPKQESKKPISLFDTSADPDTPLADASLDQSAGGKYSHVPGVAEPKLLQAPFEIPPLFPFNRTSVYLLMSPQASQKTPKSVVLRGTCQHGPLELEIPVTVLADKGETIHQLAARKAVKELEEGRGWLYHARDNKNKLLKEQFQGHFSDMVEREAVRLGVKYQVGGKWCSFVAVDESKRKKKKEASNAKDKASVSPPPPYSGGGAPGPAAKVAFGHFEDLDDSTPAPDFAKSASSDSGEDMGFGLFDDGPAVPPATKSRKGAGPRMLLSGTSKTVPGDYDRISVPLTSYASASTSVFRRQSSSSASPMPPAPPPSMGAMTASAAVLSKPMALMAACAPAPPQPAAPRPAAASLPAAGGRYRRDPRYQTAKKAIPDLGSDGGAIGGAPGGGGLLSRGGGFLGFMTKSKRRSAPEAEEGKEESLRERASTVAVDTLAVIVDLQTFAGSWKWDGRNLLAALGLSQTALVAEVAKLGDAFSAGTDLLATAVVLAYLEVYKAGEKDEWEMMADKAKDWLAGELQAKGYKLSADEYVEKVKGVIVGL